MIFAARGIMVSLAFFAIVYCFLSLTVTLAWRGIRCCAPSSLPSANVLFGIRIAPFTFSALVTLFLTFPSFLLLEAHSMDEDFGTFGLCLCCLVLLASGLFRVVAAEVRTRRAVSEWLGTDNSTSAGLATVLARNVLPIMLVGIRKPRVLISENARRVLSERELRLAVQHEFQHLRSRDNLKKAILNFVHFPGMARLDMDWQRAAELDADLNAVSNRQEALDLASALVKLSRGVAPAATPALATGLIGVAESVAMRVERLLDWKTSANRHQPWRYLLPAAIAALLCVAVNLSSALVIAHSLTERLVP